MDYAIVGTGYWGSNHVRVATELQDEGRIDTVLLCDADETRGRELAANYDLEYVRDHRSLADVGVDAATVATPSPTHHDIGCDLMRDGIDLLIEKPLAVTTDDAWNLVECAERYDRTLAVGHIFRCHPALVDLKRRIDRGELGRIKYLNASRFSFRAPRSSAGVLHSLAVHDVDVSNWLLGEPPETAYCQLDRFVREDVDETASITLEYDDATSVITESWQVPVWGKRRDLTVVGSEKAAYVDYLADNVLELYDSRVVERNGEHRAVDEGGTTYELADREPLRVEVERFLESVRTGRAPAASGAVGAHTVELLEQLALSDAENRIVDCYASSEQIS